MADQITTTTANEQPEQKPDLALTEYGSRDDIMALANRITALLPGANKMSPMERQALAQYAILTDANLWRGEIYGWDSKGDGTGDLVLCDGYKILVRWAKRQCNYSVKWEPMPADLLEDGDIGMRCWILRDDSKDLLSTLIQGGATWREAFEIAATYGDGVVTAKDRTTRYGKDKPLPTGWTWQTRAETRALKNALNRSHGMPSPREIAAMSWQVGDTQTQPSDWQEVTPAMGQVERERLALLSAQYREQKAELDSLTTEELQAQLEHGRSVLRGEEVLI